MAGIYEIADSFVDAYVAMDPVSATFIGVATNQDSMTDYSPDAAAERTKLARSVLNEIEKTEPTSESERICRRVIKDNLSMTIELYEAGEHLRDINILFSPMQSVRAVFDLMPRGTTHDWENIASRMEAVPFALSSYRKLLQEGIDRGVVSSKRQSSECAKQGAIWSGSKGASFFDGLVEAYEKTDKHDEKLLSKLKSAAVSAATAYARVGEYLSNEYTPKARDEDGVGADSYALYARAYNGIELDMHETYEWGWEQLRWVRSEMAKTAEQIKPGASLGEVIELLNTDEKRVIKGVEPFRVWMQDLQERTIEELDGVHFDILPPVKRIEALIAPPGGALAMYYTGPSEDFSRPGRTWYPVDGKTQFPIWREVSIVYHEGVPGHHFQIATAVANSDKLSRYQRLMAGTSGYVEGWALYSERLMGELGYLSNPDYYLGMLDAQALRSTRVVIDIGMHLGLTIPSDESFHPGEVWTPEMALEFMHQEVHIDSDFASSEIDRYLGAPGQAISYKVGERIWLEARSEARRSVDFDRKAWHNKALNFGPMGLAQLREEMGRV